MRMNQVNINVIFFYFFLRLNWIALILDPSSLSSRQQMNSMINDIQPYLELLNELCSLGTPLRKILVDFMINEEFYNKKIQGEINKTSSPLSDLMSKALSTNNLVSQENNEKVASNNNATYNHSIYLK